MVCVLKEEAPQPYKYQYGVNDDYTGTNFAANEAADGKVTYFYSYGSDVY